VRKLHQRLCVFSSNSSNNSIHLTVGMWTITTINNTQIHTYVRLCTHRTRKLYAHHVRKPLNDVAHLVRDQVLCEVVFHLGGGRWGATLATVGSTHTHLEPWTLRGCHSNGWCSSAMQIDRQGNNYDGGLTHTHTLL